jgi:hypothetical protein
MEAQRKQIREHLQKGKSLTAIEALHYFNCFRLSGRIHELRKEGMKIKSELITITSGGKQKRVSKYSL